MKPLLSVLMTAYNREGFLAEAIESVLASDFKEFELIIVDDCSTDRTLEIAKLYAAGDFRIRVYSNERNLGDYPNRNRAASFAKGQYLKYVDSDDRIYPETLGMMVNMMEKFPEAGLGLCDVENATDAYPVLMDARTAYTFHYFKRPIFFASPGLAIFKKNAFDLVGGFPNKRMVGDFEMWHKMPLVCSIILMPGNIYWVRKHSGQEVSEQNKYIVEYEKIKIRYLFAKQAPLAENEALEVIRKRKSTVLKIFVRKVLSLQFNEALLRVKVFLFYSRHFKQLKIYARISHND